MDRERVLAWSVQLRNESTLEMCAQQMDSRTMEKWWWTVMVGKKKFPSTIQMANLTNIQMELLMDAPKTSSPQKTQNGIDYILKFTWSAALLIIQFSYTSVFEVNLLVWSSLPFFHFYTFYWIQFLTHNSYLWKK